MTDAAPQASPGSFFLGRYEVRERLGQGAMGTVYRGHDPVLDRPVAIKTIPLDMPKEDRSDYEARFYQEARAAGGLSHPNLVTIYDIGKTERLAYMVMEYVQGKELRELLLTHAPFSAEDAVRVCAQVADGLDYAHVRGVVHRDIKPTNIIVTEEGLVKIADFGIARIRSSELKTMAGIVLGSPRYMSPEQVIGGALDGRTDIFSLGIVLYELLTGRPPFQADTVQGVMYQALNSKPAPPSGTNPKVPRILDFVVAKAIAKDANHRYRSAAAFADDLRSAVGFPRTSLRRLGESTESPPAPQAESDTTEVPPESPAVAPDVLGQEPVPVTVSGAFDSRAATSRLLALAADSGDNAEGAAPFANRDPGAAPPVAPLDRALQRAGPWLWAVAAVALAVALVRAVS